MFQWTDIKINESTHTSFDKIIDSLILIFILLCLLSMSACLDITFICVILLI